MWLVLPPPAYGTEATGDVVAGGASTDGQGDVGFDWIEVLFDDGVDVCVEGAECVEQGRHGRLSVGWFDHGTELDRVGEGNLFGADAFANLRVNLLEMDVGVDGVVPVQHRPGRPPRQVNSRLRSVRPSRRLRA